MSTQPSERPPAVVSVRRALALGLYCVGLVAVAYSIASALLAAAVAAITPAVALAPTPVAQLASVFAASPATFLSVYGAAWWAWVAVGIAGAGGLLVAVVVVLLVPPPGSARRRR